VTKLDTAAGASPRVEPELKVLALIDHLAMGGAELLLSKFAAGAPAAGISYSVACLSERDGNPAGDPLRALGIEPAKLDAPERLGPKALLEVRRHITRVAPDIVHTHLGTADLLGSIAARTLSAPAVSTLHNPIWGGDRREQVRRSLTAAARRFGCARVIAVSEYTRGEYLAHGWDKPERVVTIYNGIDVTPEPGSGRELRAELGLAPDDLVIGMVSALRPVKGHAVAIEALGMLLERFPQARLLIAGQGHMREPIERQAAELGDRVVMAGRRPDVMRVLDALDVCLHPSYADPFPGTVIEAMAASVPVLATAVGGIPEQLVDGESGLLVPAPPAAASIAGGLERLLGDPELRGSMGAAARRRYEAVLTGGPWIARTRALYDEVLAERAQAGGRS
jgi:glycosyltransferase involved in cell wall biosynthesis